MPASFSQYSQFLQGGNGEPRMPYCGVVVPLLAMNLLENLQINPGRAAQQVLEPHFKDPSPEVLFHLRTVFS